MARTGSLLTICTLLWTSASSSLPASLHTPLRTPLPPHTPRASKVLRFRRSVDDAGIQGSSAFHFGGGSRAGVSGMMSAPVRPWRATNSVQVLDSIIMDDEEDEGEMQGLDVLGGGQDSLSELVLKSQGEGPSASTATAPPAGQRKEPKPIATYHLRNLSAAEYDVYGRPRRTGRVRVPLVNRSAAP